MRCRRDSVAIVLLAALAAANAGAQDATEPYDRDEALRMSQAALGGVIGNHSLTMRSGEALSMRELRGRPLIVSMIFTDCGHICPMLTQHLGNVVEIAREALGDDSFNVATVGFDTPVDTSERMAKFAADSGVDDRNWYFLSSDPRTIHALSSELGFSYYALPKGFDHITQTTVIDAEGRIYRQVYGQRFETPALVEPLKELVYNTPVDAGFVDQWIDKLQLFCTVYDPDSGRYRFDSSIFVSIIVGLMCLGAIALFILSHWREAR
ncbi:MAG: SCO family protein [Gammaproteobacteria bacterium]